MISFSVSVSGETIGTELAHDIEEAGYAFAAFFNNATEVDVRELAEYLTDSMRSDQVLVGLQQLVQQLERTPK